MKSLATEAISGLSARGREMAELFRYAAFISYSSRDAAFAERLHKTLEAYRIPAKLGAFDLIGGGGTPNRVFPIFRDREELPSGELGSALEAALRASAALIVVCSPNSAKSVWVEKEIAYFEGLGRGRRIFAIIAHGEPAEAFPPSFDNDARRAAGRPPLELLAGDARSGKDGWRNAWLKVVAGLIEVNLGTLVDRDRQARNRRLAMTGLGAAAILGGLVLPLTLEARRQIDEARETLLASSEASLAAGAYDDAALALAAVPKGWWVPAPSRDAVDREEGLRLRVFQSSSIAGDIDPAAASTKLDPCFSSGDATATPHACNVKTGHRIAWNFEADGVKFSSWAAGSTIGKSVRLTGSVFERLRRDLNAGSDTRLRIDWDGLSISEDGEVGLAVASTSDLEDFQRKVYPGALVVIDFSGRGPAVRWVVAPEGVYAAALAPDAKSALVMTTRNTNDDETTRSRLLLMNVAQARVAAETKLDQYFSPVRIRYSGPLPAGAVQISADGRLAIVADADSSQFFSLPDLLPTQPPSDDSPVLAAIADPRHPRVALIKSDGARIWRTDLGAIEAEFSYGTPARERAAAEVWSASAVFSADGAGVALLGPWGAAREKLPPLETPDAVGFGAPARITREIAGPWALTKDGSAAIVSSGDRLIELRFDPSPLEEPIVDEQPGLVSLDPTTPRVALLRTETSPAQIESAFDIEQALVSPSGATVALRAADGRIHIRGVPGGDLISQAQVSPTDVLAYVSDGGARLVVAERLGRRRDELALLQNFRVLDVTKATTLSIVEQAQRAPLPPMPDGRSLLVQTGDAFARWDLSTGALSRLAAAPGVGRAAVLKEAGLVIFEDSYGPQLVDIAREALISDASSMRDFRWVESAKAMLFVANGPFCDPRCTLALQKADGGTMPLRSSVGAVLGEWKAGAFGDVVAAPLLLGNVGFWSASTGERLAVSPRITPPDTYFSPGAFGSDAAFTPDGKTFVMSIGHAIWALDPHTGAIKRRAGIARDYAGLDAEGRLRLDGRRVALERLPAAVPTNADLCHRFALNAQDINPNVRRGFASWFVPAKPCGGGRRIEPTAPAQP